MAVLAASWSAMSPAGADDGDFAPDAQVVADVRGYAAETQNGHAHVLRWMRVLHTLDALDDVTSTEAQGFADTYWSVRWDPVVAEIEKLEQGASAADSQVVADVRDYSQGDQQRRRPCSALVPGAAHLRGVDGHDRGRGPGPCRHVQFVALGSGGRGIEGAGNIPGRRSR